MATITSLSSKRSVIIGKLTRLEEYADNFQDTQGINQLKSRITDLNKISDDYENVQFQIETHKNLKDLDEQDQTAERQAFETLYYNVLSKLTNLLDIHPTTRSNNSNASTDQANNSRTNSARVKLPVLNLPSFSGDYTEWLAFRDIFDSLINKDKNLNNCEKMHYLKSCLKGNAARAIEALAISNANYDCAWSTLTKKYENVRLIVHEHVLALVNSPVINKATHANLSQLYNDITINLESLKALKQPVDQWDAILVPIIAEKFDYITRREWQTDLTNEVPTFAKLREFLERRCELLEAMAASNKNNTPKSNNINQPLKFKTVNHAMTHNNKIFLCLFCKGTGHNISQCENFTKLNILQRSEESKNLKLCTNCLRNNHVVAQCRSKTKCRTCNKQHHTLLHSSDEMVNNQTTNYHSYSANSDTVLLSTAIVLIKNSKDEYVPCRAFLDQGSMCNYISHILCKQLGLNLSKTNVQVNCLNGASSLVKHRVMTEIKSRFNAYSANINCLVVDKITENLPLASINPAHLEIPGNLPLADNNFHQSGKIDLLLGAQLFYDLLCIGQVKTQSGLIFQKTQLGFVAGGCLNIKPPINVTACHTSVISPETRLERQVQGFWELENLPATDNNADNNLTTEERESEKHFCETVTRDIDGRFVISLPKVNNEIKLGNTRNAALKRFYSLERRLNKNEELKSEYSDFMSVYESLNHMQLVTEPIDDDNCAYLPHHAVFKKSSTSTKLRVVFDASLISDNGRSLNQNLLAGAVIQDDLFSILSRFRTFEYALNADVVKMYRQIRLQPDDTDYHLIFWRNNTSDDLKTYRLTTLTYGTKPASYIATRCLRELAIQNQVEHPAASQAISQNFYMDDLLAGANSIQELIQLKNTIVEILNQGKFELRKFQSNVLEVIPNNVEEVQLNKNEFTKILGHFWNPINDTFFYKVCVDTVPKRITKRNILSVTAQIFDPLGILGPVIMKAKILLQQLWQIKIGWDESVPSNIYTAWTKFLGDLKLINYLSIPRKIISFFPPRTIDLIGFCDASQSGYAATVYIRVPNTDGTTYASRLLCSKSRVSPLKPITLPRLELNGALLLARLVHKVRKSLKINFSREHLFTDSTIVLSWINTSANTFKTFVASRVTEINSLTATSSWRHVRTENNAADVLSRGACPNDFLKNESWFFGPEFLKNDESHWPNLPTDINTVNVIPEKRIAMVTVPDFNCAILTKYSSFDMLQRIIAWVLRFIHNSNKSKNKDGKLTGSLSRCELQNSAITIARMVQNSAFLPDINNLIHNKPLHKKSKLLTLNPFLDKNGLIRVGGRLRNATLTTDTKYPIVLPKNHFVTKLLIRQTHISHLHAGPQATLAALRQHFWVLSGRSAVRHVVHHCIKCFKANPTSINPKMGDLPISRVKASRPFLITGVDYAGPILTRESRGRGKRVVKSYIALFVCFATKAVHIELVHDLSAEEFLGALRRFISRRGLPSDMYSDNATNFIGTKNEILEIANFFKSDTFKNKVESKLANMYIKWHFIPPRSPHMGGLWEINIKSVKQHLKRTIGDVNLTFTELYTLLVRIEACLNSRPLTPLTSDPNDLQILTPAHFLIGESLTAFPEYDTSDIQMNRLSRWQLVERIRIHFWRRWSREYLTHLQNRSKWKTNADSSRSLDLGSLVLLIEENIPPLCWKTGRIVDTHPGDDGIARVVTIKTNQGTFKRTVRKVCALPLEETDQPRA